MKCATCGKKVKQGQSICGFCGAMLGEPAGKVSAPRTAGFHPEELEGKPGPMKQAAPKKAEWPVLETVEEVDEEAPTELEADRDQETAAPPKPPAWVRYISPIFFILLFLITQFWLRDNDRPSRERPERAAESTPTLRQGGFAAELPDGRPAQTRTVFSLQSDRQVVFLSAWRGSSSGHSYSVEWHSPDGTKHPSTDVSANPAPDGKSFSLVATLRLDASFPVGSWRVEVSQDEQIVSRFVFQLNP